MRIHCTKKMLDIIKKSKMIEQDNSLELDESFELSSEMDELYDWHANILEVSKTNCLVVLVNDLTNYPVVVGPIKYKKFKDFIPAFIAGLEESMIKYSFPQDVIEGYIEQADSLLFTKSLGPKKIGPLNAIIKDVDHVLYYDSIKVADINSFALSDWAGSLLRLKDKDYFHPTEKWLEEWERRTDCRLSEQYNYNDVLRPSSKHSNEPRNKDSKVSDTVTDDEWLRLYQATDAFKKSEPWKYLGDTDLIIVQHPETIERAYCSIMGAMGEHFAMAVYIGDEGFSNFHQLASGERNIPDHQLLHAQDCLMVSFEDRAELDPANYEHIQSLGLSYKGSKQWPEIKKFEPGYHPWLKLNKGEVQWLILALEQVPKAVKDLKERTIKEKYAIGLFAARLKENNKSDWKTVYMRLPDLDELDKEERKIIIEDELMVRRLKSKAVKHGAIQLDILYAPVPVQESEEQRPLYPRLLLTVDAKTGEVWDQDMYESKREDPERVLGIIRILCETNKPDRIEIREDSIEWIVEDFCNKVGIELEVKEELQFIDEVMYELMNLKGTF
ncbi:MAG: hypothetical protein R6U02_06420 [Alkalibacterium sp.]|uniref:DUF7309 domain-containing protein n=1 Tax=Alkalibacterium sp. TaxID=1872447 RepID=UPI003970CF0D